MANANLTEIIRHIQELANNTNKTPEEVLEFEFFVALNSTINDILTSSCIETLVPIPLKKDYPFEKAQEFAKPLGIRLAEGGHSNSIYLSLSKPLDA